jgi:hypothetical protein
VSDLPPLDPRFDARFQRGYAEEAEPQRIEVPVFRAPEPGPPEELDTVDHGPDPWLRRLAVGSAVMLASAMAVGLWGTTLDYSLGMTDRAGMALRQTVSWLQFPLTVGGVLGILASLVLAATGGNRRILWIAAAIGAGIGVAAGAVGGTLGAMTITPTGMIVSEGYRWLALAQMVGTPALVLGVLSACAALVLESVRWRARATPPQAPSR